MATYEDFQKLDIRVGRIIDVEDFPEAKKSFVQAENRFWLRHRNQKILCPDN